MDPAELFHTSPFHRWLGCEVVRMDEEEVVLRLPFREGFVGDPEHPGYHGGVLAALADAAGTFAVIAATGRDWITVDMRIDYQRAAPPGPLAARAVAARAGRRIGLADVTVSDDEGRPVTVARLTLTTAGGVSRDGGGRETDDGREETS